MLKITKKHTKTKMKNFLDKVKIKIMQEEDFVKMIERLNALINYNIAVIKFRLAMMSLTVNKYMKMTNGNRKLSVLYQNIPGTISNQNLITTITSLLHRLDPDAIAIAEPTFEDLDIDWTPYTLVKGYIKGGKKIRLNILIKSNIQFEQSHWNVEVPHTVIKMEGWTIVFTYREWAKCGDQMTKTIKHQIDRWTPRC